MDINGFFAKLDAFFAGRDMQAVEAYMKESLNAAEDSGDLSSATAICNELGGYYRKLSRYKEGAALYEKALAYLEQLGLSGSEHHATTLINYATTCTQAGEREKALSFFQKAAEIFAEKGLTADYRVAALHNNISSLYQDAADLPNAEKHLRMALSVLEGLEGTGLEAAITYTNWAQLCLAADRLADAEEKVLLALSAIAQFKEAMDLNQQEFGDGSMSYAVLCDNTARCYRQLGDTELAKTFADKAEAIYGRVRA